jgi:hypothetical protein
MGSVGTALHVGFGVLMTGAAAFSHRPWSPALAFDHTEDLTGMLLTRAAEMLELLDLTPAAVRADLGGSRVAPRRLHSAAEVISRAADLCCESAGLVHDNERRWRVFRQRVQELLRNTGDGPVDVAGR